MLIAAKLLATRLGASRGETDAIGGDAMTRRSRGTRRVLVGKEGMRGGSSMTQTPGTARVASMIPERRGIEAAGD